jgi:hypothetical protein
MRTELARHQPRVVASRIAAPVAALVLGACNGTTSYMDATGVAGHS